VTALISPIPADPRFATLDMPVVAASAIGLTLIAFAYGGLPGKAGLGLLGVYAVYLAFMA
jgi:cation:H+ antiporter